MRKLFRALKNRDNGSITYWELDMLDLLSVGIGDVRGINGRNL